MAADKILKLFLKGVGYPSSPHLLRRVPISSKEVKNKLEKLSSSTILDGMSIKVLSLLKQENEEIKEKEEIEKNSYDNLNEIITSSGGNLVTNSSNDKLDGVVIDLRGVEKVLFLTELYKQLNPLVSKINKSGRIVLLGGDTINQTKNIGAITVTEAIGGFAKSLAQEVGGKGITVNALQIPTSIDLNTKSYESGVIQFFLSKRSAFISGQVPFSSFSLLNSYLPQ